MEQGEQERERKAWSHRAGRRRVLVRTIEVQAILFLSPHLRPICSCGAGLVETEVTFE